MESSELSESSDSAVYSDFEFFLPSSDGNFIFLSPDAEPIVCKKHIIKRLDSQDHFVKIVSKIRKSCERSLNKSFVCVL